MSPAPRARVTANSSSSFNSCLFGCTRASVWFVTLGQLRAHVVQIHSTRDEHYEQVVEEVCRLADQLLRIVVLGRDDPFGRLLTDLFENLIETFIEEVRRV